MSDMPLFDHAQELAKRLSASGASSAQSSRTKTTTPKTAPPHTPANKKAQAQEEKIYQVAEINRAVKLSLEHRYNDVWIQGELSDVRPSAAGHVYFTLNDERTQAQLRGVMFRSDASRSKAQVREGLRVELRGTLSLFESRGQYQMIARQARVAGAGNLAARFEEIRKKLEKEGLFSEERKRELPYFPRVVGVVTSTKGAALRDVLRVADERCPTHFIVADCRVQGDDAPASILAALKSIQRIPDLDVVIITRGGGSSEDLWAFNDEQVARAIAACKVPVVSGVGHEVDITIADLVADTRAATPSNAAEIVVPERDALIAEVEHAERRLQRAMESRIDRSRLRLQRAARTLHDPPPRAFLGTPTLFHTGKATQPQHACPYHSSARAATTSKKTTRGTQSARRPGQTP